MATSDHPDPMRVYSRRSGRADALEDAITLQRTLIALRGRALVPRGVYRFRTHEQADAWMIRQMAVTHARRKSATSSRSAAR